MLTPEEWFYKKLDYFTASICEKYAVEAEREAKDSASWQDRTGMARKMLKGVVIDGKNDIEFNVVKEDKRGAFKSAGKLTIEAANSIGIALAHRVVYGIDLETANDGRYAVLKPVMERIKGKFMSAFREFFG